MVTFLRKATSDQSDFQKTGVDYDTVRLFDQIFEGFELVGLDRGYLYFARKRIEAVYVCQQVPKYDRASYTFRLKQFFEPDSQWRWSCVPTMWRWFIFQRAQPPKDSIAVQLQDAIEYSISTVFL